MPHEEMLWQLSDFAGYAMVKAIQEASVDGTQIINEAV